MAGIKVVGYAYQIVDMAARLGTESPVNGKGNWSKLGFGVRVLRRGDLLG